MVSLNDTLLYYKEVGKVVFMHAHSIIDVAQSVDVALCEVH